jgi:small subunit ribosomal protein S20
MVFGFYLADGARWTRMRPRKSQLPGTQGPKTIFQGKRYFFGISGVRTYLCRPKNVEFMANHKATKKDVRQAEKRRDRNRYYGKTTRNAIRDLKEIKVQKEAGDKLPEVASMIDKLAKKGIIHKNKAANLKSKLARKVNGMAATAAK